MDVVGIGSGELNYESVATTYDGFKGRFGLIGDGVRDSHYTDSCFQSTELFGCISLRNKKNCILNKQYTKEEYDILSSKIKEHMNVMPFIGYNNREYKYGDFYPSEICPFAYNESWTHEYFPLTKQEALLHGYKWKEADTKDFNISLESDKIP